MEIAWIYITTFFILKLHLSTAWHEPELNAPYYPIEIYKYEGLDKEYLPEKVLIEESNCNGIFLNCVINRDDLSPICVVKKINDDKWYDFHNPCQLGFINCIHREYSEDENHRKNFLYYAGDDRNCRAMVRVGTFEDALRSEMEDAARILRERKLNRTLTNTNSTKTVNVSKIDPGKPPETQNLRETNVVPSRATEKPTQKPKLSDKFIFWKDTPTQVAGKQPNYKDDPFRSVEDDLPVEKILEKFEPFQGLDIPMFYRDTEAFKMAIRPSGDPIYNRIYS